MIDLNLFHFNKVALAVSGGRDSMALLYDVARNFDHNFFYVINVEHGIRGKESIKDSEFVEKYAKSLGIEFVRYDVDAISYSREHGYTLEQGARILRREIFEKEVREGKADRVAVAHHQDDNIESILMHIFRGSGLRGIKGMTADDGVLIRPLLQVTREDIDDFVDKNVIPFVEDSTNSDSSFRRNFIRNDIMPLLHKKYETISSSILRLSDSAKEDDEYLMSEALGKVSIDDDRILVDANASPSIFKRAIYIAFKKLGVNADIEQRHYNILLDLTNRENGTTVDMPFGVKATLEYGKIAFYRQCDKASSSMNLVLGDNIFDGYVVNVERVSSSNFDNTREGYRVLYASDDVLFDTILRHRLSGDMFEKFGGGKKKLKDYLIDKKIPNSKRDVPLIVRGNEVLCVCGVEIADRVRVCDNSNIVKITLRRNTNGKII